MAKHERDRLQSQTSLIFAPYRVFATSDGYITLGASQQKFFQSLCDLIGLPELVADPRFGKNADRVTNNASLVELIQAKLAAKSSAHWLAGLEAAGIPAGPVLHYDEVFTDPQILARDMVVETDHTPSPASSAPWACRSSCRNRRAPSAARPRSWANTPRKCWQPSAGRPRNNTGAQSVRPFPPFPGLSDSATGLAGTRVSLGTVSCLLP